MRWTNFLAIFGLVLFVSVSLDAQRSLRRANKEYDIHAYNLAIERYLQTLDKRPDEAEALWKLGNSYRLLNNMEESVIYFERAVRQRNVDPVAHLYYGHALRALGLYDEASAQYRLYEKTDPVVGLHFAEVATFAKNKATEAPTYEVKSEYVNTTSSDFAAIGFGIKTVFASSRTDIRPRGGQPQTGVNNQLFITDADKNGFLKPPRLLREGLSARGNEAPIAYSPDGRWVAVTHNNFVDGRRQIPEAGAELSLYIAEVTEAGNWSKETPFPFNGSGFSTGYGSFSPDGRALYFASDRPDGFGGFDIYVSYRVGTSWSTPENLGAVVNSQGNEISPFYDGSTLYFSSDWHPGLGGYDIFRAERVNERWTSVYHLGTGINSSRDDLYFSYDNLANRGYFTSNRSGRGQEDIYRVSKASDQLLVQVLDATTRQPIENAEVDFSGCGDRIYRTDRAGNYRFQMRGQVNCSPIVRAAGYSTSSFAINAATLVPGQKREVLLTKSGGQYTGRITDQRNGLRLGNVRVRATDQRTGRTLEAFTNSGGEYTLNLAPNTTYLIRFSRDGYSETSKSVRTGAAPDANLLSVTSLLATRTTTTTPPTTTRPSTGTTGGGGYVGGNTTGGGSVTYPGNSPNVSYPGNPTTTYPPTTTRPTTTYPTTTYPAQDPPTVSITSGYSVQFLATGKTPDMGRFQAELGSLGDVYYRTTNGINKVRVGVYSSRQDAERIKAAVRRAGYGEAFIVDEAGSSGSAYTGGGVGSSTTSVISGGVGSPRPNTSVVYPGTTVSGGDASGYMIKLGAYRNTRFFDRERVQQIGYLTERRKGDLTIFLLSGYGTLEDAQRGLRSARSAGFSDAYIVQEINGELKTVK